MANRLGFKEFLKKIEADAEVQLIVDANVIIALRDNEHRNNVALKSFFSNLENQASNIALFTTVTTKSEFLEYYRRKILTRGIQNLYKINKDKKIISDDVKIEIERQVRARNSRQKREVERQDKLELQLEAHGVDTTEIDVEGFSIDANYFTDSEIKKIKKSFRGKNVDNEKGWFDFCNSVLLDKLHQYEKLLDELYHYLTTKDKEAKQYFIKENVEWPMATQICGENGIGYSDAMIINMANHTSIRYIISLDYDIITG